MIIVIILAVIYCVWNSGIFSIPWRVSLGLHGTNL